MKGEIFNLLEDFIVENWGVETFEKIYTEIHEKLATKEPFVGPGTYPDSDFIKMAGKAVEILGVSLSEAVNAFGKFCFPRLAAKMPNLITPDKHPKEILLILDSIIHVEVKKVYKDSEPPKFSYKDITDNS
ncbi:MAG: heme NO-binding domain-containing protein, partial [Bdellovibrionales bacterium]|nr:heme NO-binding domain-containing protein [Bdellovibrionales bacterium]